MAAGNRLIFHPQRILWLGALQLGVVSLFGLPFLLYFPVKSSGFITLDRKEEAPLCLPSFSFGMQRQGFSLPIPDLENEILFLLDPLRPEAEGGGAERQQQLRVHLPRSGASKRAALPARVDLQFVNGRLSFSSEPSSFWLELASPSPSPSPRQGQGQGPEPGQIQQQGEAQIEVRLFTEEGGSGKIAAGRFSAFPKESPLRPAHDFPEGSPFRALAEARSWGPDLVKDLFLYGSPHERCGDSPPERIEIGSPPYFLGAKLGEWMVWEEGRWKLSESAKDRSNRPIARIVSNGRRNLTVEGWDSEGHIRLLIPFFSGTPFKARPEDLFSAVRIRSEKQISCMLEKQCLVLKPGDWVLKVGNRWKILRKKQERESFLNQEMEGELFVFEQIVQKLGQKVIQGRLFNAGRSQAAPIEIPAQTARRRLDAAASFQKEERKNDPKKGPIR